jgi:hypothetical protein
MEKASKKKLKRARPETEAVVEVSKKSKIDTVTKVSDLESNNKTLKKSKNHKLETSGKSVLNMLFYNTIIPMKRFKIAQF